MKKAILLTLVLAPLVGCATQPSTYVDMSTADQRDVRATGAAAVAAAHSNTSKNVNVLETGSGNIRTSNGTIVKGNENPNLPYTIYKADGTRDHRAELKAAADRNNRRSSGSYFSREFSYELDRKIRKQVDRTIDDIFN
jgi:hypothetical protein